MGTLNGFGTGFRGWQHRPDGTSVATSWILFAFMPVVPLRRYHLRTLTDFENEKVTGNQVAGALVGSLSWSDPVQILARLPLSWREIGLTYARAYVLVPLLCLWPFAALALALGIAKAVRGEPVRVGAWIQVFLACASVNAFLVLLVAARRMRGCPGARKRTASADSAAGRAA